MSQSPHSLIRQGRAEADDFTTLADEAQPASGSRYIVPLARYEPERETLLASGAVIGISLPNTADIDAIWPTIADRPLIAPQFPAFADGRAYSQARLIAQRHRFKGELRATGVAVVRDQIHFMARCGFNSFALRDDQDTEACLAAWRDFSLAYQPAADGLSTVLARRRAAG
jgi:uncharacterized protein (DUF934 family)